MSLRQPEPSSLVGLPLSEPLQYNLGKMEFLLEIGVEDLPAGAIPGFCENLTRSFQNLLEENRLSGEIEAWVTIRRLVVRAKGLPPKQPDKITEVLGPPASAAFLPNGALTQTGLGYCRAHKINPKELKIKEDGKKKVTYYLKKEKGKTAYRLLREMIPSFLASLSFELPMRWGEGEVAFVRPITSILALLEDKVLPVAFAGIKAKPFTFGHPTLGATVIKVKSPSDYFQVLRKNFVMLNGQERFQRAVEKVNKIKPTGASFSQKVLDQIVQTLEYPQVAKSKIDLKKIPYPKEIAALVIERLKCLPLYDPKGNLLPEFIIITDGQITAEIKKGFHWVLMGRLEDALFFWQEDTRIPVPEHHKKLAKVIFQAGVGTLSDYVRALEAFVDKVASGLKISAEEREELMIAARMAKIDATTSMVREFPEVTGIMAGSLLEKDGGYSRRVCETVKSHHLPRYSGDDLPHERPAQVLSFCDKMMHLCGLFLAGVEPSGSSDPYGLRRLAQGMLEVAWAGNLRLSLNELVSNGLKSWGKEDGGLKKKINDFLYQRLENIFENRGFRPDIVASALYAGNDILTAYPARISALVNFISSPAGTAKVTTFTRITNILVQAREKGIAFSSQEVQPQLFTEEAEKELFRAWNIRAARIENFLEAEQFEKALGELSELDPFINRFFDKVLVMAPDEGLRRNRLALLDKIASVLFLIGDLRRIQI